MFLVATGIAASILTDVRVIVLLASYNEERFIAKCLEHLQRHKVETYLLDNCSTDRTVEIAQGFIDRGLIAIETVERRGVFRWTDILRRKEELAAELDADWFIHADPDEVRLPPRSGVTLAEALVEVDACGDNAVNFQEFVFTPVRHAPDHDHPHFMQTMRWYYPFLPSYPHRLNAWKRRETRVDLISSGGHKVGFPGRRVHPKSFPMRHYLFLSPAHAHEKYVEKKFAAAEVKAGWHGWRAELTDEMVRLPDERHVAAYLFDDALDAAQPRRNHFVAETWAAAQSAVLPQEVCHGGNGRLS